MPVFLRPRETYKSQWDGDQHFSPLQLCIGRSCHYAAHALWTVTSLTPPKHNTFNEPRVFCWERDATSPVSPCSLCHPCFRLLGLLSITSHGWLCPAGSSLCHLTSARHFPGAPPDGVLPLFIFSSKWEITSILLCAKKNECRGVQVLKGGDCS